jgi:hypothetical protein
MYQPFGAELAKIRSESLRAEAARVRRHRPSRLRSMIGRGLIVLGSHLVSVERRASTHVEADRWRGWRVAEPDAEYRRRRR